MHKSIIKTGVEEGDQKIIYFKKKMTIEPFFLERQQSSTPTKITMPMDVQFSYRPICNILIKRIN